MNALGGLTSPARIFDPQDNLTPEPTRHRSVRKDALQGQEGWTSWVGGELVGLECGSESTFVGRNQDEDQEKQAGSKPKRMDSLVDYKGADNAFSDSANATSLEKEKEKGLGVERKDSMVSVLTPEEEAASEALVARRAKGSDP